MIVHRSYLEDSCVQVSFHYMHIIEAWATGLPRIKCQDCEKQAYRRLERKQIIAHLKGVAVTADEATVAAKEIIRLKSDCESKIVSRGWSVVYNILLDYLFEFPIDSINDAVEKLQVSYPTAVKVIDNLCSLDVLQDITPDQKRNKKYAFVSYMEILNRGTELL